MNPKERAVLRQAKDSNEGQISPAIMINSYAGGDQGVVERLVSQGYLERVYQFREGINKATYSIIFYAVTEKGLMEFATLRKRIWFKFKSNIAVWIGIVSIIVGSGSLIFTGSAYFHSVEESKVLNRPYYFIETSEIKPSVSENNIFKLIFNFENSGKTPALVKGINWKFTHNQDSVPKDINRDFLVSPGSENTAQILFTKTDVELIKRSTGNFLLFQLIYSDINGIEYCTESRYYIVESEQEYKLAVDSIQTCPEVVGLAHYELYSFTNFSWTFIGVIGLLILLMI